MATDRLYQQFIKQWDEVTDLPPQSLGPLTPFYKRAVRLVKVDPWKIVVPIVFILVAFLFLTLDVTAPQIASILQYGF